MQTGLIKKQNLILSSKKHPPKTGVFFVLKQNQVKYNSRKINRLNIFFNLK